MAAALRMHFGLTDSSDESLVESDEDSEEYSAEEDEDEEEGLSWDELEEQARA